MNQDETQIQQEESKEKLSEEKTQKLSEINRQLAYQTYPIKNSIENDFQEYFIKIPINQIHLTENAMRLVQQIDLASYHPLASFLMIQNNANQFSTGSGVLIKIGFKTAVLITDARNLLNNQNPVEGLKIFYQQTKLNEFHQEVDCKNQSFFITPNEFLAMIKFKNEKYISEFIFTDHVKYNYPFEELDIQVGNKINILGYPQEYKGQLYEIELVIEQIITSEDGQIFLKYFAFDLNETSKGSPIFWKKNDIYYLIGIHVRFDGKFNVGVGYNRKLFNWMMNINQEIFETKAIFKKDDLNQTMTTNSLAQIKFVKKLGLRDGQIILKILIQQYWRKFKQI